ncbi:MAG TPA: nitrous oxide reductase accessory protein NosL, partial [Anaeromyxobacteraceae bacterium]|nr:nitrous oxide reductase accessory protein NosL [Anaeromyxobacteraceae bacterium]
MRRALAVAAMSAAVLAAAAGGPARAAPADPAPGPRERCPVCGMFVAKYPEWLASLRLRDGTVAWFDGPKDLARYLRDPV